MWSVECGVWSCCHTPLRSAGGAVPALSARGGRCASLRSALIPNIRNSRSLLIDRCGGVLFPVALTPIAAYEAFSRVQSERSERLRE